MASPALQNGASPVIRRLDAQRHRLFDLGQRIQFDPVRGHADQREISSADEIEAASLFGWINAAGLLSSPNERVDWGIPPKGVFYCWNFWLFYGFE